MKYGTSATAQQWLTLLAMVAFLGWVIPNHHRPWTSFHAEAWLGLGFLFFGAQALMQGVASWRLNLLILLVSLLLFIPFAQYAGGMVLWTGQAWVSTLYLLGLWLALVFGFNTSAEQETRGLDFLFLLVTMAGTVSVGLQLLQWSGSDVIGIWLMNTGQVRPSANFGQPNQLGTLLLLAMVGAGWWWYRGFIGARIAIFWGAYLLIGVALTRSRTAFLNIFVISITVAIYSLSFRRLQVFKALLALVGWLFICIGILSIDYSTFAIEGATSFKVIDRLQETTRPQIWGVFWSAILERPWLGYGWNQTGKVHVEFALLAPYLGAHFGSAHNILLDLMLWVGIPLALLIVSVVIFTLIKIVCNLRELREFLILAGIAIVFVHALLEFPLYYAYFLVPVGYFLGVLSKSTPRMRPFCFEVPRWFVFLAWCCAFSLYAVAVSDYFKVERRYNDMLHEKARIGTNHPNLLPEVLILNDLRAAIQLGRLNPAGHITREEIVWAEKVTYSFPSMGNFFQLAQMYSFNHRDDLAKIWLKRGCAVMSENNCFILNSAWSEKVKENSKIADTVPRVNNENAVNLEVSQ